ncbi:phosphoribosylglycinamide formyltransferase [Oleidesulfovibrio sp.]|uniref:phosphoribosylglycinamide formyltransferase n=1 Tax=Oleidesulfovibrio sp. TaxID=2909707 RepID=UPI003A8AEE19
MPLQLAVLASGNGSNLQAVLDRIADGALDAEVRLVASNKEDAFALERARKAGVPVWARSHTAFADRESFDTALVEAIRQAGADTIVLAGYMRLLTPVFLNAFPRRVINIHPALLPSFPGVRGVADAVNYGVRIAGCTVHFVDEIMDHGPVIIQAAIPMTAADSLDAVLERVHAVEHRIYPQALQWLAEGRLKLEGRVVHLASSDKGLAAPQPDMLISPALEQGF